MKWGFKGIGKMKVSFKRVYNKDGTVSDTNIKKDKVMKNKIKFVNGSEITFKKTEDSEEFKSADIFNYIDGKSRTEFENEPKLSVESYGRNSIT